jgi:hypothetical protein
MTITHSNLAHLNQLILFLKEGLCQDILIHGKFRLFRFAIVVEPLNYLHLKVNIPATGTCSICGYNGHFFITTMRCGLRGIQLSPFAMGPQKLYTDLLVKKSNTVPIRVLRFAPVRIFLALFRDKGGIE